MVLLVIYFHIIFVYQLVPQADRKTFEKKPACSCDGVPEILVGASFADSVILVTKVINFVKQYYL